MLESYHVLGSRQFGGADQFYVRLIEALNATGNTATAIDRAGSPVADALAERGLPQIHLPLANKWDVFSTWRLKRLVARNRPAIVQTYMGRATRLTRLSPRGPAVHVARLGGYYKIRGYYEHAHAWVGNTKGVCDYLVREGLPADRVFHIGNFVPEPEPVDEATLQGLRDQWRVAKDDFLIFTLGRFIDIKGFDDLLQAFSRLPADTGGRRLILAIAGDGPLRDQLHALARDLNVEDRVRWLGWQNNPAAWFRIADLMVCPSRHETLGNVILEAWSHGLPVVTTDTPGAEELVTEGSDALVALKNNPDSLAERLGEALNASAEQRQALGKAGRTVLERTHTREAVVEAYLNLYEELSRQRALA